MSITIQRFFDSPIASIGARIFLMAIMSLLGLIMAAGAGFLVYTRIGMPDGQTRSISSILCYIIGIVVFISILILASIYRYGASCFELRGTQGCNEFIRIEEGDAISFIEPELEADDAPVPFFHTEDEPARHSLITTLSNTSRTSMSNLSQFAKDAKFVCDSRPSSPISTYSGLSGSCSSLTSLIDTRNPSKDSVPSREDSLTSIACTGLVRQQSRDFELSGLTREQFQALEQSGTVEASPRHLTGKNVMVVITPPSDEPFTPSIAAITAEHDDLKLYAPKSTKQIKYRPYHPNNTSSRKSQPPLNGEVKDMISSFRNITATGSNAPEEPISKSIVTTNNTPSSTQLRNTGTFQRSRTVHPAGTYFGDNSRARNHTARVLNLIDRNTAPRRNNYSNNQLEVIELYQVDKKIKKGKQVAQSIEATMNNNYKQAAQAKDNTWDSPKPTLHYDIRNRNSLGYPLYENKKPDFHPKPNSGTKSSQKSNILLNDFGRSTSEQDRKIQNARRQQLGLAHTKSVSNLNQVANPPTLQRKLSAGSPQLERSINRQRNLQVQRNFARQITQNSIRSKGALRIVNPDLPPTGVQRKPSVNSRFQRQLSAANRGQQGKFAPLVPSKSVEIAKKRKAAKIEKKLPTIKELANRSMYLNEDMLVNKKPQPPFLKGRRG